MQRGHVRNAPFLMETSFDKLHSLHTPTISEILDINPALDQSKCFTNLLELSSRNRFSFANTVGISPQRHSSTASFIKIIVQYQAKLELRQRASQKSTTNESLLSICKYSFPSSDTKVRCPVVEDHVEECDDWLVADENLTDGTSEKGFTEASMYSIQSSSPKNDHLNPYGPDEVKYSKNQDKLIPLV